MKSTRKLCFKQQIYLKLIITIFYTAKLIYFLKMQLMNEVLKFPFSESLEIIKEVPAQFSWFMEALTKVCAT